MPVVSGGLSENCAPVRHPGARKSMLSHACLRAHNGSIVALDRGGEGRCAAGALRTGGGTAWMRASGREGRAQVSSVGVWGPGRS